MYQVYCRGRKNCKWVPYSKEYEKLEDANRCKVSAEARNVLNVYGNVIQYKIVKN